MIEWVAQDAEQQSAPGLYWNTLDDAPARALYDKVGKVQERFVLYTYRRDAKQIFDQR
jgi:hypothetical protein